MPSLETLCDRIAELEQTVSAQHQRIESLECEVDALEAELEAEREARQAAEAQCAELAETVDRDVSARLDALSRKTEATREQVVELQSRSLEKGGHLLASNVDPDRIDVHGQQLERITKDDEQAYFRLPGEEDPLARGGAVVHSTADLLPLQRLARFDDEMLASTTNRKPDELAAKAWRQRDDPGRYKLWSKGGADVRVYMTAPDLADWIRQEEAGVSKKYSQELARRTIDAMIELARGKLGKTKRKRRTDGLTYHETRVVLHQGTELPGERPVADATGCENEDNHEPSRDDEAPATDAVVGE
ncbi:hypothetical protein [Haloferax larsenii]|uniref:Uncharacterized protein n=1 Tax=Haloferax larsenii TaxID=302484 RepID=A0A1H7TQ86_HALLR|nr:hypothetical protein [Haloferax larsenii]SEL87032.1 hypothetical protein SAMN04488691_11016 [Haloferax larsenii]